MQEDDSVYVIVYTKNRFGGWKDGKGHGKGGIGSESIGYKTQYN